MTATPLALHVTPNCCLGQETCRNHFWTLFKIIMCLGYTGSTTYFLIVWIPTFQESLRFPKVPYPCVFCRIRSCAAVVPFCARPFDCLPVHPRAPLWLPLITHTLGRYVIVACLLLVQFTLFTVFGRLIDRVGHMRRWMLLGTTVVAVVRSLCSRSNSICCGDGLNRQYAHSRSRCTCVHEIRILPDHELYPKSWVPIMAMLDIYDTGVNPCAESEVCPAGFATGT